MTSVTAVKTAEYKPVSYEINGDYNFENTAVQDSIFTTQNMAAHVCAANEDKEEGGFFNGIKNFFSGIFKGIGDFFKGLFSKEDEAPDEPVKETETDNDTEETKPTENNAEEELPEGAYYDEQGRLVVTIVDTTIPYEGVEYDDTNTKDGTIGYTKQGDSAGDCWLLSGVNSLSYTEEGKQIIKDALDYKDGETVVHLKGAQDYTITDEELEAAKSTGGYSRGDEDMVLLELAVQKALNDISSGKVNVSSETIAQEIAEKGNTLLRGGRQSTLFYLLTGKESEVYSKTKDGAIEKMDDEMQALLAPSTRSYALDAFEENGGKDIALSAGLSEEDAAVTDIYGNNVEFKLQNAHGYSIKEINGDNVTVVNPWDSGKEIVLSKDTVLDTFDDFTFCDLS